MKFTVYLESDHDFSDSVDADSECAAAEQFVDDNWLDLSDDMGDDVCRIRVVVLHDGEETTMCVEARSEITFHARRATS